MAFPLTPPLSSLSGATRCLPARRVRVMDAASAASAHLHDTTVMSAPQPIDHVVVLHTAQPDPRRRPSSGSPRSRDEFV